MPTIRISEENYAYLLGVATRLQFEESKPKNQNDALNCLIKSYKKTIEEAKA